MRDRGLEEFDLVGSGDGGDDGSMRPTLKHWGSGWLASGVLVALVTVIIKALHPHGPSRGLAVLYILAVVAIAVRWGPAFAFVSSLLSALAFDYFFLGRYGDLQLSGSSDLEAFGAYLATAIMAGLVASLLRHRAQRAQGLAAEQESQRKIASLVARGASPADVLAGIREELGRLAGIDVVLLLQWDLSGRTTVAAALGVPAGAVAPAGEPSGSEPSALVRTVKFDEQTSTHEFDEAFGPVGGAIRDLHLTGGIGGPVRVGDRTWGFVIVAARNAGLPSSVERDVAAYTELLAAAIGNSEDRADLVASRRRIITAADETRRKIERDLHDGAQQGLVSLALTAWSARERVPADQEELRNELSHISEGLVRLLDELREMTRGLHPAILTEGGLLPALRLLARRSPTAVELDASIKDRLPEHVEVTVYYVASELLANVAKHAHATHVRVRARATDEVLTLSIHDDGVGGAAATRGSGLLGVVDRVSANNGTIAIRSPVGHGTAVDVVLPYAIAAESDDTGGAAQADGMRQGQS